MREIGTYISDIVKLDFTFFNGSTSSVSFDNQEIVSEVRYVPGIVPRMLQTASGAKASIMVPTEKFFGFEINTFPRTEDNREYTRAKIDTILKAVVQPYTCVATFKIVAPFSDDALTNPSGDYQNRVITFNSATIELPSDFSYDTTRRGIGGKPAVFNVKVYQAANIVVPPSPCDDVIASDLAVTWNVDVGLVVQSIDVTPSANIGTVLTWGSGIIVNTENQLFGTLIHDGTNYKVDAILGAIEVGYRFEATIDFELADPVWACSYRVKDIYS